MTVKMNRSYMDLHEYANRESPIGREKTPSPERWPWSYLDHSSELRKPASDHWYNRWTETPSSPILNTVLLTCRSCHHRMQTAADVLLSTNDLRPLQTPTACTLNRSLARCRDRLLRATRTLTAGLRGLIELLDAGRACSKEACVCLEEIGDTVLTLTEVCAHTAFVQALQRDNDHEPERRGVIGGGGGPTLDRYTLSRAVLDVERNVGALSKLHLKELTPAMLRKLRNPTTASINVVKQCCEVAAKQSEDSLTRTQFELCSSSISACADTMWSAMKILGERPSSESLTACQSFGDTLVAACRSLVGYGIGQWTTFETPTVLGWAARQQAWLVLSAAMAVVTPCIIMCNVVRDLANRPDDQLALTRAHSCLAVFLRGSTRLAGTIGVTVIDIS